ncbi:Sec-independent protein translocase protein TATA, chloroplastic [Linum grandiflorum]
MEISSTTMSVSRLSPVGYRLPSSTSASFNTISLFNKSKKCDSLVMGGRPRIHRAKQRMTCNALFGLGVPELVVIAGVAALVFGPKKLPEVGKSIGKTVKSFQQAAKEFETELKKEPESLEESPAEKPVAMSEENKKQQQELEVSNSKDSA